MQMIHCKLEKLMGLSARSCCALMDIKRCCSRTLESPQSSSISLKSASSTFSSCTVDDASVFLRLVEEEGVVECRRRVRVAGTERLRVVTGILGGDESAVRSMKPCCNCDAGQGRKSLPALLSESQESLDTGREIGLRALDVRASKPTS